jgi:hypothetical protein
MARPSQSCLRTIELVHDRLYEVAARLDLPGNARAELLRIVGLAEVVLMNEGVLIAPTPAAGLSALGG